MYKNNTGSFNKNPYEHLNITQLKQAEKLLSDTANWFQNEVTKFEKEAQILSSPDCEYAEAERIKKRAEWFEKRREFELDQLEKYNQAKARILLTNLLSGVVNLSCKQ